MGLHGGKMMRLDTDSEEVLEKEGQLHPLWGQPRSIESRVLSNRIQAALQLLPKQQRRLLIKWSRGTSLRELGRQYKVSHEAIRGRLRTAIADFKKVVAEHLDLLQEVNDL